MCKSMEVKICLIGMGNVGTSFLQLLKEKRDYISVNFNFNCKLVAIFEHDGALINNGGIDLNNLLEDYTNLRKNQYWTSNAKAQDLISTLDIDICIETTPTNPNTGEPALSHILEAKMNCFVKFEATVASCVPALSIKESLIGNTIFQIRAILNGTNNYILSRMTAEGVSFSVALKEAQELGYAETDPTLDINGYDAAGKLVILSNELLGWSKSIKDVKIKGITKITPHALELAKLDGYVIKHLAIAEDNNLTVEPRLVKRDSPLNIQGTLNLIELQTRYAGSIILKKEEVFETSFHSTNYNSLDVDFKTAVLQGQAIDNGLYMLNNIPRLTDETIDSFKNMDFVDIANIVISKMIGNIISQEKLQQIVNNALNFEITLQNIANNDYICYLDRGPTCSFKDFGARTLARIMEHFLEADNKNITILTAVIYKENK